MSNKSEALSAAKRGEIIGFLWFASNFTQSIFLFNDDSQDELVYHDNGFVQAHLDMSDLQKASLVEQKLFKAYEKFIEGLMGDCGKSRQSGKLVIATEALIGKNNFDFKSSLVPGMMLS
jgi:hypothetical protein